MNRLAIYERIGQHFVARMRRTTSGADPGAHGSSPRATPWRGRAIAVADAPGMPRERRTSSDRHTKSPPIQPIGGPVEQGGFTSGRRGTRRPRSEPPFGGTDCAAVQRGQIIRWPFCCTAPYPFSEPFHAPGAWLGRRRPFAVRSSPALVPPRRFGHNRPARAAVADPHANLAIRCRSAARSPIPDPRSLIPDPRSPIPDPRSPFPVPRPPIPDP